MNRDNILKVAGNVWKNIVNIKANLYKGELDISGNEPAGICFLDLEGGEFTFEKFADYQEEILANEYYKHPGIIQWNYYLFLLQDSVDLETKQLIEKDDKYARKYVLNESEFEDFFSLEVSSASVNDDIVLKWKKKLDGAGLQDVYSKVAYTTGVDKFLSDKPSIKVPSIKSSVHTEPQTAINFINKIILHGNYREYPKIREIPFAKVNLVTGINGVGKTSLFEALELIACGRTHRNFNSKDPDNCISAVINNNSSQVEKCTPSNNEKYRIRDFYWYNNDYPRDNYTVQSFNRFNFFNTDAGNNFVNSNSEEAIKSALNNLILGPEYNYIKDRMSGFASRIGPIYRQLNTKVDQAKKDIISWNAVILKSQVSNSLQSLQDAVLETTKSLNFHIQYSAEEKDITSLELEKNKLKTFLEVFDKGNVTIHSLEELDSQKSLLKNKRGNFSAFKQEFDKHNGDLKEKDARRQWLIQKKARCQVAITYLNEPISFTIKGLSSKITSNTASLRQIHIIKTTLESIDLSSYKLKKTLGEFLQENTEKLESLRKRLHEIDLTVSNSLQSLDRISSLIGELKSLGKAYISIQKNSTICPLCQTEFNQNELSERINSEIDSFVQNPNLVTQLHTQRELKNSVDSCIKQNSDLELISSAYKTSFGELIGNTPLEEIITSIENFIKQEDSFLKVKAELESLNIWATSNNLSEAEIFTLENEFGELFSIEKKTQMKALEATFLQEITAIEESIEAIIEKKSTIVFQIKSDLELPQEKTFTTSEIIERFEHDNRIINHLEDSFQKIGSIINLKSETKIEDVIQLISLLDKNLTSLKQEIQNQFERRNAEKEKEKAEAFILKNKDYLERIKEGFDLLTSLLEDSSNTQLSTFFDQNFKEVGDIFRTIHSPREFKGITFSNKECLLIRNDGKVRKISEISTGQRAALAISLFISLNRKLKNGPNIIMFDDPIAHIDDLNALSFLDFLRLFILKEGKQIFFATANARLATLIEKKFLFLGDDFKQIQLNR